MKNNFKPGHNLATTLAENEAISKNPHVLKAELQALKAGAHFEDRFNKLFETVLLKKLRKLKTELKGQYAFRIETTGALKNPQVKETTIIIKSKADHAVCKLSIIRFLNKQEFSIQGVPLYSKPLHLYNKTALIPFIGTLETFEPEKFEGYIFQILHYCFQ